MDDIDKKAWRIVLKRLFVFFAYALGTAAFGYTVYSLVSAINSSKYADEIQAAVSIGMPVITAIILVGYVLWWWKEGVKEDLLKDAYKD